MAGLKHWVNAFLISHTAGLKFRGALGPYLREASRLGWLLSHVEGISLPSNLSSASGEYVGSQRRRNDGSRGLLLQQEWS